jgi:hypothetical protein
MNFGEHIILITALCDVVINTSLLTEEVKGGGHWVWSSKWRQNEISIVSAPALQSFSIQELGDVCELESVFWRPKELQIEIFLGLITFSTFYCEHFQTWKGEQTI